MGGMIVTIVISASLFAVLILVGLIFFPKFAALFGSSGISRAACNLRLRLLRKVLGALGSAEGGESSYVVEGNRREASLKPAISKVVSTLIGEENLAAPAGGSAGPNMGQLNCRVKLGRELKDGYATDAFCIEICGIIRAADDQEEAVLKVTMRDVTGPEGASNSILSKVGQWRVEKSGEFCYSADLGKLTGRETILSNWTSVGKIQSDWLLLPRKGERDLELRASILSRRNSAELACASYTFAYDNDEFGYYDLDDNRQRARTLAVALAFTVSAADGKMFKCEVDVIRDWARANVCSAETSDKAQGELEKALDKTFAFFRDGHKLNTFQICKELVDIASLGGRCDIMELCLHVVQSKGSVSPKELGTLRSISDWLELDTEQYREMSERILPVNMHETKDAEALLGVSSGMSEEKMRQHLNREYSKWNARVTNSDPQIQAQADEMLSLIAEARREYVG